MTGVRPLATAFFEDPDPQVPRGGGLDGTFTKTATMEQSDVDISTMMAGTKTMQDDNKGGWDTDVHGGFGTTIPAYRLHT
jgi:hypothetical protein